MEISNFTMGCILPGEYLVRVNISREEQIKMALGGHLKWTPERVVLMIVFFAAIITSLATLVWFLFFVL